MHSKLSCALAVSTLFWMSLVSTASAEEPQVDFNRDIRPLLSDKCFHCHGNDHESREAELRFDQEKSAKAELPSGSTAIVPGDIDASELVARIVEKDSDLVMPPHESGKKLSPEEIELFKRWIAQGAEFKNHWAFETPVRPDAPQVQLKDWASNPIDQFVLARLEREKLKPTPEADRVTLIRRVTLDLTGLPPTPAEVDAFLKDHSPSAYEKLVERLLASPRYAEHKARYWLDAVRFADTHGMHYDNYREIWPYRDWVLRSLDENKPFDQFVTEQFAGDLLPKATLAQQVASGFNRCNMTTNEGGSIYEEVYVRNVIDRVNTVGTVFLGMTVGCAQCHDHKYDPISQKEYFQLFAFFNNLDGHSMDGNVKDHAPHVPVPTDKQEQRIAKLENQIAGLEEKKELRAQELQPAFLAWLKEKDSTQTVEVEQAESIDDQLGLVAYYPLDESEGDAVANLISDKPKGKVRGGLGWSAGRVGGGFRFDGEKYIDLGNVGAFRADSPFSYGGWIKTPGDVQGAAISRMDDKASHRGYDLYISGRRVAAHVIHKWPQYALKVTTQEEVLKPNTWHHVFVTYGGTSKSNGLRIYVDGEARSVDIQVDSLSVKGRNSKFDKATLRLGRRTPGSPFRKGEIDDVRIYGSELTPQEVVSLSRDPMIQTILDLEPKNRSKEQANTIREYYLEGNDKAYAGLVDQIAKTDKEIQKVYRKAPTSLVFRERIEKRPAYLLERGEYDQKGEEVSRITPSALPPMSDDLPRDRLGFAKWLLDPKHPLTSRVIVNQYWQQYFGTGLVKTSENFGLQGDPPSHPELLDWLATEFVRSGWDVKQMHRLIVTSSTYRQSSKATPESYLNDPENRLLARGPRYRLDAEMLRDQSLATSGLLVNQLGGPSVKPPQPSGLWKAVGMSGSNTSIFKADKGDSAFRRSVYVFWKRTSPPPYLAICDAPSREASTVRRERTNTPLAALLLMNEEQNVLAARSLAQRAMTESGDSNEQRATFLYKQVTLRKIAPEDLATLVEAYEKFLSEYEKKPEEAKKLITLGRVKPDPNLDTAKLAAWTMVANIVLNLDEVINKG